MKTGFLIGLLVPAALVATAALADDKAACLDAASKGQRLRDTHKLVEAREQLRVCAAAQCPSVVQSDCANWLADVEKALPSVVLSARNAAGVDLVDVKVSVDGQPLVSKLDGQAVSMNAGPHTFHFDGPDAASLDEQKLLREGEKNQAVAVVFGPAPPAQPASQDTVPVSDAPSRSSSPWKTVGWVLGGVGIAGLGVGTVFGVIAAGDKTRAHCDANNVCDPGTVSGIKSAALGSDVGWIAGGVLLASGAALVLFAPSASREPTAALRVAPFVTARGGEIVAGGTW